MKKTILAFMILMALTLIVSCDSDATVASYNLSKAADQFEIYRRVVFYNGITDEYILVVEGYCSIEVDELENQLELTVKTDDGTYLKHFLGLSDNVTYFVEQIEPSKVSDGKYKVIFKPSVIVPDIEVE
jgi:hypothetical protein